MGFLDEDDEYDEPDWMQQQEEEADAWHQILEGNQDEEEWDGPPSPSDVLPLQSPAAPAANQFQGESTTGSLLPSPSTPQTSAVKSPLRRRRSDNGSPVRLPIEGLTTQSAQDDPYWCAFPLPESVAESPKRPSLAESSFETPAKMRRLRSKTTPSSSSQGKEDHVDEPLPEHVITGKVKEYTKHINMRHFFVEHMRPHVRSRNPALTSPDVLQETRKLWNLKTRFQQLCWCQNQLSMLFKCVPYVVDKKDAEALRLEAELEEKKQIEKEEHEKDFHRFRTRGCLGTWNGRWLAEKQEWKQIIKDHPEYDDLREALHGCPPIQALAKDFEAFLKTRCERLNFDKWSWQFELSTNSEDEGRLHIHAFWHSNNDRCHGGFHEAWAFGGCKPVLKHCSARGKAMQRFLDRGHYYCQTNKIGWLLRGSNYCKYSAFAVEQRWVIGLWQLRKLSHAEAKHEIIQARGHTKTYLSEISFVEACEQESAIEQKKAED